MLLALWDEGSEDAWRWFGCAALGALACSHASLVAGAKRASDSRTIRSLSKISIALGVFDTCVGIVAIAGIVDEVDEGFAELVAVFVILLILTSALPPILRRLQRAPGAAGTVAAPALPLAEQVLAAVDRIEALNGDPGNRAPEIRRECDRLRELARSRSG